ncbi:G-patch domain protein [Aspergillus arachidicola]|uniref:G-patch domain protein n=1 Tax=Aspergillus arachidicola TaxID=656916 RepID=A0A2G7EL99_9EURO|nr:G-patch domain protein [Aspergillus arachidicola]
MAPHQNPAPDVGDEEEDDYMSMVIEEPQQKETFTQKKRRQQREAEARAKVPSKAERAAQEAERRDAALATSTLNPSNKGFQMMAKLGFKPGQALGKSQDEGASNQKPDSKSGGRAEPLNLVFKEDRGGIVKKVKQEEGDYRDRVRIERETRRTEAQFHAAQKVAERLDAEAEAGDGETVQTKRGKTPTEHEEEESEDTTSGSSIPQPKVKVKPTSQINILYRGLVREREEKERSIQARHLLQTSLPSSFFPDPLLPGYDDPTLEREDKVALDSKADISTVLEQELDEEDPELDEFNALEPGERLARIVQYLRETHHYCFWCKFRYETGEMEGCPGVTEEDHD